IMFEPSWSAVQRRPNMEENWTRGTSALAGSASQYRITGCRNSTAKGLLRTRPAIADASSHRQCRHTPQLRYLAQLGEDPGDQPGPRFARGPLVLSVPPRRID